VSDLSGRTWEGRVAVITGGASGIGLAMAHRFAEGGMRVVIADVNAEALARVGTEGGFATSHVDVRRPGDLERLREETLDLHGRVDLLCNNAAVDVFGHIQDLSLADWQWILEVNLWGVVHGIRAFLPHFSVHGGHILNTASRTALAPMWAGAPYTASKCAIVAISEILHNELAGHDPAVGVSVLIPTVTRTAIGDSSPARPSELARPEPETEDMRRLREHSQRALAEGIDPSVVAERTWEGLQDRRFWILATPESADLAVQRAAGIAAASPVPPGA
jgi:NAD(P)-dependent dehydrogenase (short-subunit alcohol dehydrogenase family)